MKKRLIGVILSDATAEYPRNILKGIMEQGKKYNYNIAVFSTFIRSEGSKKHKIGETHIFQLPNYKMFDGIIILPSSIKLCDTLENIKKDIQEQCTCPVICADNTNGFGETVLTDEESDFMELVEHFITQHGFSRINFFARNNIERQTFVKILAYKKALLKHHIPIEEERIIYGDCEKKELKIYVMEMLSKKIRIPQVIVCEDDSLAIEVCDILREEGIRVPEDICVSGYGNCREAVLHNPSITTLRPPQNQVGMECVEKIYNYYEEIASENRILRGELVVGESCGCNNHSIYGKNSLLQRKNFQKMINTMRDDIYDISLMRDSLLGLDSLNEFLDKLGEKIYLIRNYRDLYLCLNSDWEQEVFENYQIDREGKKKSTEFYSDVMRVAICNKDKLYSEGNYMFLRKYMLPQLFDDNMEAKTYFFVPLHFEARSFGYVVVTYEDPMKIYDYELRTWVSNVSTSLEILRTQNNLRQLHRHVENLSLRDTLTGVFNRRGLEKNGLPILNKAIEKKIAFAMFLIDLDKLKEINDTYGHKEGDSALVTLANVVQNLPTELGFISRTGGDEFIYIFNSNIIMERIIEVKRKILENLKEISNTSNLEYEISASIGIYHDVPRMGMTLEDCQIIADKNMYREKEIKKGV